MSEIPATNQPGLILTSQGDGTQNARWGTLSAGTSVTMGGDVLGPSNSAKVVGLQNLPVANTAPSTNYALVWNGTAWTPEAQNATQLGGTAVSSTPPTTTNDLLVYNGSQWVPAALRGDVTGQATGNAVGKLQGSAVSFTTPTTALNLFVWNGTAWTPTAMNADATMTDTGAVTIQKLQGYTLSIVGPVNGNVLTYNGSAWVPQAAAGGAISNTANAAYVTSQTVVSGGTLTGISGLTLNTSGFTTYLVTTTVVIHNNDTVARTADLQIQVGGVNRGNVVAQIVNNGADAQFATTIVVSGLTAGTTYTFDTLATIGGATNGTAKNGELTVLGVA